MSDLRLRGAVIAVTADHRRNDQAVLLERHGATVRCAPMFRSVLSADLDELERGIDTLINEPPDTVILHTSYGARALFDAADACGKGNALRAACKNAQILCRGTKTTGEALAIGFASSSIRTVVDFDDLVGHVCTNARRVAVQNDGGETNDIDRALSTLDVAIVSLPTYRWCAPVDTQNAEQIVEAASQQRLDAITFTSAPAVEHMALLAHDMGLSRKVSHAFSTSISVACVGPSSRQAALQTGWKVAVTPERHRLGAMIDALADHLSTPQSLRANGVQLELRQTLAVVGGVPVPLPPLEHGVLAALLQRRNLVVAKADLITQVWGPGAASEHTVEMTVARLRNRLGPVGGAIRTVTRRGYTITATSNPQTQCH